METGWSTKRQFQICFFFALSVISLSCSNKNPSSNDITNSEITNTGNTANEQNSIKKIPTVLSVSAANLTYSTVTLNGTVNADGLPCVVYFEWGLTVDYGNFTSQQPFAASNENISISADLTGLAPDTAYKFRLVVTNSIGTSYSEDKTFTTTSPPPSIVSFSATDITYNSAILNAVANPNNLTTTAYFEWGFTAVYGNITSEQNLGNASTDSQITEPINGLLPNTIYNYRIVATNSTGAVYGENQTFTTNLPPPVASTSQATGVTYNSAILTGAVNPNGLATTAYFKWGLTADYGSTTGVQNISAGTANINLSADLAGLAPDTTYNFQLVTGNLSGMTFGENQTFVTIPLLQPTTTTNPATEVTHLTVTLNGTINPNGLDTIIFFEWGTTTTYGSTTTFQVVGTGIEDIAVLAELTELIPDTDYNFQLVAVNLSGTTYGENQTFKTIAIPPTIISTSAMNVGSNSATLNATVNPNGLETTVYFEWGIKTSYGNTPSPQSIGNSATDTNVTIDLTNLASAGIYNFRVIATNSAGSSYSENQTFNTINLNIWVEKKHDPILNSPVARLFQNAIWDGTNVIFFWGGDGFPDYNDLWWYNPQTNSWTEKIAAGDLSAPSIHYYPSKVWDGSNMIVFGGGSNDLLWYNPETNLWIEKIPHGSIGSPPVRYAPSMVWNNSKCIMFGGSDKNDLWWYDPQSNTWTEKITDGFPGSPSKRMWHSMVWDGANVILFGGYSTNGELLNDLWWYNPETNQWTQKIANNTIGSPSARFAHTITWNGETVILFGGGYDGYSNYNDLWWYNPQTNTWTEKIANGIVGMPDIGSSMVWDGAKIIMSGASSWNAWYNEIWWYLPETNTWIPKIPNPPRNRTSSSMVWDGSKIMMFGGMVGDKYTNDLWWYDPGTNTWEEKIPYGDINSPFARYSHTMVWDGIRVIMFGGEATTEGTQNDLWWYDVATNTWTEKIENNSINSPSARWGHSMVWDGMNVILFGGSGGGGEIFNDTWWYNPTTNTWTEKIANGVISSPAARYEHAMSWNGEKIILFGGNNGSSSLNDLWWYDPETNTWSEKISDGTIGLPAVRSGHSMVFDGIRTILFGGYSNVAYDDYKNDLWWYDSNTNTWIEKISNGDADSPLGRACHTMIWDGINAIIYGGVVIDNNNNIGMESGDLWWYSP